MAQIYNFTYQGITKDNEYIPDPDMSKRFYIGGSWHTNCFNYGRE